MAAGFFFYDLETSGFSAARDRIMQFAGQRTDMELKPVGEPINVLVKLAPDTLPSPDAIMITGITPQQTQTDGLTEAEFLEFFYKEVMQPETIFMGYNSIRFDDEFMRYLHWRNFYDPYEWHWADACSRWDLLDLVRMTRALRPEGIEWPFTEEGKPTNRLALLTKANGLDHAHAHDALSDVHATIGVARLIKEKQPDLFTYLLGCRKKQAASELVLKAQPFVYTTGNYPSESLHTSVSVMVARHTVQDAALVYDLRHDPTPFLKMSVAELVAAWQLPRDAGERRLPVKTLKYNRCPAVAPLGVIKEAKVQERLQLSLDTVQSHLNTLKAYQEDFASKLQQAIGQLDAAREQKRLQELRQATIADEQLYDGFISKVDKPLMRAMRTVSPDKILSFKDQLSDRRLQELLPLYKARNYPRSLNSDERAEWDKFCQQRLAQGGSESRLARYFARLQELAKGELTANQQYLLEELQLYGQSILPTDAA